MSSIYQAVAADLRGNRPSRGNPIVQNDRSFRDDGNINADIEKQRQAEALIRKQARMQEGGRGGRERMRRQGADDRYLASLNTPYDDMDDWDILPTNGKNKRKWRKQVMQEQLEDFLKEAGRLLLQAEANPEQKTSKGRIALDLALEADVEGSHSEVIALLHKKPVFLTVRHLIGQEAAKTESNVI
eukprot:g19682.t1